MSRNQDNIQHGYTSTRDLIGRLVREHLKPYKGWLFCAVFMMSLVAGATAFSAYLMEHVVNDVFINKNRDMLWLVSGTILVTFLIKGVANYGQSVLMSFVGLRIVADCQNRLYKHLVGMDLDYFHKNKSGSLISRFTIDINSMRGAVSNTLTSLGKDLLTLIGLIVVMVIQDPLLSVFALIVFPIAIYPIVRLGKKMRKVVANNQKEMGLFTALLGQSFQGIRMVKAYGMQAYETTRIGELVERIFKLNIKAAKTQALSSPIMETLGGFAVALVVVYGGYRVMDNHTDAGSFFSFLMALLSAYEPMKRLANLNANIQAGMAGAERMFHILDTSPEIVERENAKDIVLKGGGIKLTNVVFSYDEDAPALKNISIDVPAGKTVALVGPSGAGKSTVLNLIPRFYDVNEGSVTIDGFDVRDMTFASLHGSVALVSQEIMLFDDTVRANIAYGREGASEEEIMTAAKGAAAHDFILALSDGYDTMVGEQGVKLSGGQRQRLAIARAMLKNAPILLLDEATSALDTQSERQVQDALEGLMKGRTAVVIAHRLSTVVNADLIYVIVDGKVREQGTHDELIAKRGHYATLYELQFRDSEITSLNE